MKPESGNGLRVYPSASRRTDRDLAHLRPAARPIELHFWGNAAEAALWLVLAALCVHRAFRAIGRLRLAMAMLAGSFAALAVSDLIEMHTGAWWRPWGLLLWKAAALAWLAVSLLEARRAARSARR